MKFKCVLKMRSILIVPLLKLLFVFKECILIREFNLTMEYTAFRVILDYSKSAYSIIFYNVCNTSSI